MTSKTNFNKGLAIVAIISTTLLITLFISILIKEPNSKSYLKGYSAGYAEGFEDARIEFLEDQKFKLNNQNYK